MCTALTSLYFTFSGDIILAIMAFTRNEKFFVVDIGEYLYRDMKFTRIERKSSRRTALSNKHTHTCFSANQLLAEVDGSGSHGFKIPSCKPCDDFRNKSFIKKICREKLNSVLAFQKGFDVIGRYEV